MAYAECEAGIITLLQALTAQFPTAAQVSTSSKVLDSGIVNAACVYPGGIRNGSKGPTYVRVWEVMLNLYTKYLDEDSAIAAIKTLRAAVVLKLDENPTLGGVSGVYDTDLVSEGDPYLSKPPEGINGAVYMAQNFRISVFQYLRVT